MATNLTVKTKPIILKYAKQGMPGRTGPAGEPGKDATNWTVSVTMEGIPSGTCRVRLYKDGVLNADETHYAAVYVMQTHRTSFALSAAYSHNIIGTYTFQYTDVRAVFVVIYDDSFMENVLTAQMAQNIRGRDLKLLNGPALSFTAAQWRVKGAAGTVNTWTTGSSYDNSTLEDGDLVCIIGTVSDQLDGSGNPISCMLIGQAQIAEGGSAAASVSVISRALFVGQQGAKGDKGDRGEPGQAGTSVPWGGITGSLSNQDDLVAALAGKVSKTGDTMTGTLQVKDTRFDTSDTNPPSSGLYFVGLGMYDANNKYMGYFQAVRNTNGKNYLQIAARRIVNSANKDASLVLYVDAAGNTSCSLPKVTSGTWEGSAIDIAHGGTGATSAAAALTALGAAPASHSHDAGDINSGTLPIARGGTGASTAANALTNLGAVSKAGGTMTGQLNIKSNLALVDSNNVTIGAWIQNSSNNRTYFRSVNESTNYRIDAYLPIPDNSETAHGTKYIPFMTAGTSDLTAGSSALTTNCIRLVYE